MSAIVIDTLECDEGTFVITEISYGRTRKYGLRQVMPGGRWAPIGGVLKSLEGAYSRYLGLVSGDATVLEMQRQAQIDHAFRFQRAA